MVKQNSLKRGLQGYGNIVLCLYLFSKHSYLFHSLYIEIEKGNMVNWFTEHNWITIIFVNHIIIVL